MQDTDRIKERIDIVEFIGRYVELKKAGINYSGLCPFHGEKTPSFIVSPERNRYKCFGCGRDGDIFTFLMETEGYDFPQALEKLAKEAGIELKKTRKKDSRLEKLFKINDAAQAAFVSEYKKNSKIQNYVLENRGISSDSVERFQIGYAPSRFAILSSLKSEFKESLSEKNIDDSGLFSANNKKSSRFNDRLIFPIHNVNGKIVGFSGRQVPGNDFGPKYLNTPETPIFHKREILYGLFFAKEEIRKKDYVVVVEGQIDVISSHQIDRRNCVAPLGTALTKEQLQQLKKFTDKIVFIYDNDKAGQKALLKSVLMANELGFVSYAANPKPAGDFDELCKTDKAHALKISQPRTDAYTYIISVANAATDTTTLAGIKYLQRLHNQFVDSVREDERKWYEDKFDSIVHGEGPSTDASSRPQNKRKSSARFSPEEQLLGILHHSSGSETIKKFNHRYFSEPLLKQIIKTFKESSVKSLTELREELEDQNLIDQLDRITLLFNPGEQQSSDEEIKQRYLKLRVEYLDRELKIIPKLLRSATAQQDSDREAELIERQKKLILLKRKYDKNI